MKILFIKLGALGDVINTLPLAVLLKEELGAEITWLVEPLSLPLISEHPAVAGVICFDKKNWRAGLQEVRQQLRGQHFDLVLDLQRIFKSVFLAMLAKADRKIGFNRGRCKDGSWLFPLERLSSADPGQHMLKQYLEFASHLGVSLPSKPCWNIPVKQDCGLDLPPNYIVLNIGATKKANLWTAEGFAELADLLAAKNDLPCVITGGSGDLPLALEILALAKSSPLNLIGKTSIDQLCTVLDQAVLVVTCDTGPMHLAVALGTEVVALFGPSNPRRTGPFVGRVVQADIPCMPCNKRKCTSRECMLAIKASRVYAEIQDCLRKAGTAF